MKEAAFPILEFYATDETVHVVGNYTIRFDQRERGRQKTRKTHEHLEAHAFWLEASSGHLEQQYAAIRNELSHASEELNPSAVRTSSITKRAYWVKRLSDLASV